MGFFFFFSAFNIGQFEMVLFDFEDEDDVAFSVQFMGHPPPAQGGRSRQRGHLPGKGTVTFSPSGALCFLEAHSDPFTHSFVLQTSKKLREEPDQPCHPGDRQQGLSPGLLWGSRKYILALTFDLHVKIFVGYACP